MTRSKSLPCQSNVTEACPVIVQWTWVTAAITGVLSSSPTAARTPPATTTAIHFRDRMSRLRLFLVMVISGNDFISCQTSRNSGFGEECRPPVEASQERREYKRRPFTSGNTNWGAATVWACSDPHQQRVQI